MNNISRRASLRLVCGCTLMSGAHVALAQAGALAFGSGNSPADLWRRATSHVERAVSMSGSVTRSLDTLTRELASLFDRSNALKKRVETLVSDLAKLKASKDALMEEYRQGQFCSGCGQTRSQILAKGEKFPHPGQSIVQPTPAQIEAKDRELQRPIDDTATRLSATQKDLRTNDDKLDLGLEQVRLGVTFWRASSSYARLSVGGGADMVLKTLEKQRKELEANLAASTKATESAKGAAREQVQQEAETWQRLVDKNRKDTEEMRARIATSQNRVTQEVGDELQRIQGFVTRGELFARVGGPSATMIFPTAQEEEMGVRYLMGRLPEARPIPGPLSSVRDFTSAYQRFPGDFPTASALAVQEKTSAAPARAESAAPAPRPSVAPGTQAPSQLLRTLP